jgi:acetyltransferase-like isoleucine patch superfamily enzyme
MGPKAYVGAYTDVETKAFIGQCSVLISGKARHIGSEALIGAGSVVTKPVPEKAIVAGNPARILKYKP